LGGLVYSVAFGLWSLDGAGAAYKQTGEDETVLDRNDRPGPTRLTDPPVQSSIVSCICLCLHTSDAKKRRRRHITDAVSVSPPPPIRKRKSSPSLLTGKQIVTEKGPVITICSLP
jgi:hypothetical protein